MTSSRSRYLERTRVESADYMMVEYPMMARAPGKVKATALCDHTLIIFVDLPTPNLAVRTVYLVYSL